MRRDNQCDLLKLFILLELPINRPESTIGTLGMLRIASVLNALPQSAIAKKSLSDCFQHRFAASAGTAVDGEAQTPSLRWVSDQSSSAAGARSSATFPAGFARCSPENRP